MHRFSHPVNNNASLAMTLALVTVILAAALAWLQPWKKAGPSLTIALVAPLQEQADPERYRESLSMINGATIAIDRYNRSRKMHQPKIRLKKYFEQGTGNGSDKTDPISLATATAKQVVKDIPRLNTIAVLGHRKTPNSLAAAQVYRDKIHMIGGTAASPTITSDNEWSDSVIVNNRAMGQQLARYLAKINKRKVLIVYLAGSPADEFGCDHNDGEQVPESPGRGFDDFSCSIVDSLIEAGKHAMDFVTVRPGHIPHQTLAEFDAIVLALRDNQSVPVIREIRDTLRELSAQDITLLGSTSIGKHSFPLDNFESGEIGFYTDDIIAPTSILFDSAGERAQHFQLEYMQRFNEPPDSAAAAYFDAANLVIAVLSEARHRHNAGYASPAQWFHHQFQAFTLRHNDPYNSVPGITGPIYFGHNGIEKDLYLGQFNHGEFITAPLQVNQAIIYTGFGNIQISEFDSAAMRFKASFDLWMRSQSPLPDASKSLTFSNLYKDSAPATIEDCHTPKGHARKLGKFNYIKCKVEGEFQAEYDPSRSSFGEFELYIRLRHKTIEKRNLLFVSDLLADETTDSVGAKRRFSANDIGPISAQWLSIISLPFQSSIFEDDLGLLAEISGHNARLEYSSFNYHLRVKENTLWIRGSLPELAQYILLTLSLLVLGATLIYRRRIRGPVLFALFLVFVAALLLAVEPLGYQYASFISFNILKDVFDTLWIVYLVMIISIGINVFVWDRIESKTQNPVPNLMRTLTYIICVLGGLLLFIAWVLQQNPTSLLATSGIAAMLFGLALQPNMVDFFAGIALNIDKKIEIGRCVKVDDKIAGTVLEINWRTTTIQADDGSLHAIPNSTLAKQVLTIQDRRKKPR